MLARAALLGLETATLGARAVLGARCLRARRHAPPPHTGPFRALFLAQYPEHFAGTKYRLGTWAERLRRAGHEVELSLAVPAPHGERLAHDWSVRARSEFHLRLLAQRVPATLRAARADVVVVHMNDLPFWEYGAPFVARALRRLAGRVLLDLDDLPVFGGESTLRPRARELARSVDGLIVGTHDLLDAFREGPAWVVPTCVEPSEWHVPDRSRGGAPPVLGWVGSPGNQRYLERLAPVLAELCEEHGAVVRVVSSRPPRLPGVPVEFVAWSAEREAADLEGMDVGLAPLDDGEMERRKCGLKALQYMASGLPVVASPVGALARIVRHGETGFHATSLAEWRQALARLLTERTLRTGLGIEGREAAVRHWSFAAHEQRFVDALRGLAPERARGV